MRYVLVLCAVLLCSCNEKVSEQTVEETVVSETEATLVTTGKEDTKVPIYNFSELEPLLQKKNDTTYVVNFWATWCKPCIKELPYFEKVNKEYADKKVKVVLVSLDFPDILEKQVIPFIEKRGIQSQVVLLDDPDANGWIPKVSPEWSGAIPATIIYNSKNRKFYEKAFTQSELETEIQSIL